MTGPNVIESVTEPAESEPRRAIRCADMVASTDGDNDIAHTGQELREARLRLGLTITDVGKRIGLNSRRSVTRWESDGIPRSSRHVDAIERCLGLGRYTSNAAVVVDPDSLSDGALWSRVLGDIAVLQRRYWEARPTGVAGPPLRIQGAREMPYPTHLDEEGSSHDRGESYS